MREATAEALLILAVACQIFTFALCLSMPDKDPARLARAVPEPPSTARSAVLTDR